MSRLAVSRLVSSTEHQKHRYQARVSLKLVRPFLYFPTRIDRGGILYEYPGPRAPVFHIRMEHFCDKGGVREKLISRVSSVLELVKRGSDEALR